MGQVLRKYKERVNSLQPSAVQDYSNYIFATQSSSKGSSGRNEYYVFDNSHITPANYFELNSDVRSFAPNYNQIRLMRKYTTELNDPPKPLSKTKYSRLYVHSVKKESMELKKLTSEVKSPLLGRRAGSKLRARKNLGPTSTKVCRMLRLMNVRVQVT